jgi:Uma2 family endonuclease
MRSELVQLWCRATVRRPADTRRAMTTAGAAKTWEPHRNRAERRRDLMKPAILDVTSTAAGRAVWPQNHMPVGLRGHHCLLHASQKLLPPRLAISPRSRDRLITITSTLCPRLSGSASTNRKTHLIRDPPAGNGPTGHIASVLIPHFLDTPANDVAAGPPTAYVPAMTVAIKLPPRHMTVAEFLDWSPGDGESTWQLRDGEPELMAPASDAHGSIQGELARLLGNHLASGDGRCRVVVAPGVIPRVRSERNMLVPDLGVTCSPPSSGRAMPDPVVLIEILSPSNEAETRANVWAFSTIPTVVEIVVVGSAEMAAEVLRRGADGSWPERPDVIGADDELQLDSIGFAAPLRQAYRTSGLN